MGRGPRDPSRGSWNLVGRSHVEQATRATRWRWWPSARRSRAGDEPARLGRGGCREEPGDRVDGGADVEREREPGATPVDGPFPLRGQVQAQVLGLLDPDRE